MAAAKKSTQTTAPVNDKKAAIETLMARIERECGKGAIMRLGENSQLNVSAVSTGDFKLSFDPTLVRGMGYYTGTIFEVSMEGFGGSVAGGGRYDKMIGKFTGMDTPACGFSIGFERIVTILMDAGFVVPTDNAKEAWLFEKGMDMERLSSIMKDAMEARKSGKTILVAQMNKNKKFQKDQLGKEGYTEFKEFFKEALRQ